MAGCGGKKKMEAGGLAKAAKGAGRKLKDTSEMLGKKLNRKPPVGGMLGGARPMAPGGKKRMLPPLREREAASAMERARQQSQKPARRKAGGMLKTPDNPGLKKLPTEVRNKMGYMKKGGMAKKYEEGGKVDKSKGVKGRTSAKAKRDQKDFQMGYNQGLKAAKKQFNLKGKKSLDKVDKPNILDKALTDKKILEGRQKGAKDMKAALKGQGAYKKGGKVYCKDGCAVRGKTKGRLV